MPGRWGWMLAAGVGLMGPALVPAPLGERPVSHQGGPAVATAQGQQAAPVGVVRAGQYRLRSESVSPPGPEARDTGAVYGVSPYPLEPPDLAPGEGRDATVAMCSVCHSVRYIVMQPLLPAATWEATVRKMIDVHGAQIPADVEARIISYLQQHYGEVSR